MAFWKLVLAWGCLTLFFGIPLMFFAIHITHLKTEFYSHAQEFKYMSEYLRTITAIIISLAGFNTVEFFKK